MPASTIAFYDDFIDALSGGVHDMKTGTLDVYKVVLHSDAPVLATDTTLANLTQPTGTGYTAGGETLGSVTGSTTAGTFTFDAANVVWTAGAADWTAFRYVSLYNDTQADRLIGYWDYGSNVTLGNGETFTLDLTNNILQIDNPST